VVGTKFIDNPISLSGDNPGSSLEQNQETQMFFFLELFIILLHSIVYLMSKTASVRFYRTSKNRVSFRQGVMNLINF